MVSIGPHINDLIYAWYGGTPSINDAEYQALLLAYNNDVNAFMVIGAFSGLPTASSGDVLTADGAGAATWLPGGGGGGAGAFTGLLAARPAAAAANEVFYYATDVDTGYISDGATWTTLVFDHNLLSNLTVGNPHTQYVLGTVFDERTWKNWVRVATVANGTLSTAFENGDTIDGIVLATGDRILIKDQTAGAENGIYTVNASGSPTRATDYDSSTEILSSMILVAVGTINGGTAWRNTNATAITVGTTALTFNRKLGLDIQVFTSSGTWTKPNGARAVFVRVIGGGAGGGSGDSRAGGVGSGGGGGGNGGINEKMFEASALGATVTVTVGTGGTTRAGTIGAVGTDGQLGNDSGFGSPTQVLAQRGRVGQGGAAASVNGGRSGLGMTTGVVTGSLLAGGAQSNSGGGTGTTGTGGTATSPGWQTPGSGGGGGGGGSNAGGPGGSGDNNFAAAGTAGASNGGAGGAGGASTVNNGGGGGGGGGGSLALAGGAGGTGGVYGGGGGGGGSSAAAFAGGTGAAGADGIVVVITYF